MLSNSQLYLVDNLQQLLQPRKKQSKSALRNSPHLPERMQPGYFLNFCTEMLFALQQSHFLWKKYAKCEMANLRLEFRTGANLFSWIPFRTLDPKGIKFKNAFIADPEVVGNAPVHPKQTVRCKFTIPARL
uniref:Uncharacterized protein n=1 Tax=Megaselia scalaris TaxID=36166 RepID=T1GWL6_MEGSC